MATHQPILAAALLVGAADWHRGLLTAWRSLPHVRPSFRYHDPEEGDAFRGRLRVAASALRANRHPRGNAWVGVRTDIAFAVVFVRSSAPLAARRSIPASARSRRSRLRVKWADCRSPCALPFERQMRPACRVRRGGLYLVRDHGKHGNAKRYNFDVTCFSSPPCSAK